MGQGSGPAFTMKEIRKGVGYFSMSGGTIGWFVDGDNLVVIDSQFPEPAEILLTELEKRTSRAIDVFFNTHHHGDHTSGNAVIIPKSVQSIAHENCKAWQKKVAVEGGKEDGQAYPETTFKKKLSISLANESITAEYFGNAHTSGDIVIHFEEANVVHLGDLVFNRHPPFIDRDAGASIVKWMDLLNKLHGRFDDDTRFIYGHGKGGWGVDGSREDLLVMHDFLGGILEHARKGLIAGKSVDDIANVKTIPGFPDHYVDSAWGKAAIPRAVKTACAEVQGS